MFSITYPWSKHDSRDWSKMILTRVWWWCGWESDPMWRGWWGDIGALHSVIRSSDQWESLKHLKKKKYFWFNAVLVVSEERIHKILFVHCTNICKLLWFWENAQFNSDDDGIYEKLMFSLNLSQIIIRSEDGY